MAQTIAPDRVLEATGASLDEWFRRLDAAGARDMDHKATAVWLADQGVAMWWCQTLTVEYERHIGRRVIGQTCTGDFQLSVTKMLSGELDDVLALWEGHVEGRRDFAGRAFAEPRITITDKWRYWRTDLDDGTKVTAIIGSKGDRRCQLAINHERLDGQDAIEGWRPIWRAELDALAQ